MVDAFCTALETEPAPFDPVEYVMFCIAILGLYVLGYAIVDTTESWREEQDRKNRHDSFPE